jgi:hypothetical protein
MQQPSSDNRASAWKSLMRKLLRLVSFWRIPSKGRKHAPDGTASWQQVGVTGQRDPCGWGRSFAGRFARRSVVGGRRKCADVRSADAVTLIKGTTRGADIGPLGDVPILPSHHGRGQHGCGDQPSRQNFKSGHFSFSIEDKSQNILASALEMSGATGDFN